MHTEFAAHMMMWLFGFIFFFRVPVCRNKQTNNTPRPPVSIIVPARNEEENIPNLVRSLKPQIRADDEIIIIDDHSEDNTAAVAKQEGARIVASGKMPPGWTGKTWACYQGAQKAAGDLLVFLDADTLIEKDGLDRIISNYLANGGVLSIQPYHKMRRLYEQLSAFFNLVLMAAMGSFTILGEKLKPIGLFGPVMVLERNVYFESGGFEKVKGEILEDLALGAEFKKRGLKLYCYGGRGTVSFRMYSGGMRQLINGWSKGFAKGAVQTSIPVLILIIAWLTGAIGTTRHIVYTAIIADIPFVTLWALLYSAYALQIYGMLYRIGNFKAYVAFLFPVPLVFFFVVFAYSFIIIFVRKNMRWKGRTIDVRNRGKHVDSSSHTHHHTH
jgi:4,4'-diaponeurosporenoate glycosyltransferase